MYEVFDRKRIAGNMLWNIGEGFVLKGVAIIWFLIVARMLTPAEVGITGLVTVFFNIAKVLLYAGLNSALIQRKDITGEDKNSVYFAVLVCGVIIIIFFYISAPLFGIIYKNDVLSDILRVMPFVFLLGCFDVINEVSVARTLSFKKSFISNTCAVAVQGFLLITMLNSGYGIWSWVYALMARQLAYTIVLSSFIRFLPKLQFSIKRIKDLWKFGHKVLWTTLLDTVFASIYKLTVGIVFDNNVLGYYNQGAMVPETIQTTANTTLTVVAYPILSSLQDNEERHRAMIIRMIKLTSFIIFPVMAGIIAVAEPLVKVLLTEKWLPCVPYIRILAAALSLYPFCGIFTLALNSIGKSAVGLKTELVKKGITALCLLASIFFGIYGVLWGALAAILLITVVIAFLNRKYFLLNIKDQVKWVLPCIILSALMGLIVFALSFIGLTPGVTLLLQIITGIVLYIAFSLIFKIDSLKYLLGFLKKL